MTPTIYTGFEDTGYKPAEGAGKWGKMPDIYAATFHHSAGPRATTKAKAIALHKAYQKSHIDRGFGDIGYHFSMDDLGRFYTLRSLDFIGAHVGEHNTGNVGIMLHGNYMHDTLTVKQEASLEWLFKGGFYVLLNERERDIALVRGHKEWSGHNSNDCPGRYLMPKIRELRNTEFH